MSIGSGYYTTKGKLTTSKENEEIIPKQIRDGINLNGFCKFSFLNTSDCTVIVNNKDELNLIGGYGFETGFNDYPITSFKIKEEGTEYFYYAEY